MFGFNGNMIVGFLPYKQEHSAVEKLFEEVIGLMCEAAGEPQIYITAGISYANEQNYFIDDMLLNADRGMGLSRTQGCKGVGSAGIKLPPNPKIALQFRQLA